MVLTQRFSTFLCLQSRLRGREREWRAVTIFFFATIKMLLPPRRTSLQASSAHTLINTYQDDIFNSAFDVELSSQQVDLRDP